MKNMSGIENQEIAAFDLKQKAEIYLSQGKLNEAYDNCSKALEVLPNSGEIYKILGNIWQRMGKLESAKKSYKQAIEYNPNLAEVLRGSAGGTCKKHYANASILILLSLENSYLFYPKYHSHSSFILI